MGEVVTTMGNATIIHENDIHFNSNLDQLLQQVHCMIAAFMSPLYTLYSTTKWLSRKRESSNGQISILNHSIFLVTSFNDAFQNLLDG